MTTGTIAPASKPTRRQNRRDPRPAAPAGSAPPFPCRVCEAPALVRVLTHYERGEPVFHHYCLSCAESPVAGTRGAHPQRRVSFSSLLIALGIVSGLLAFLGESLPGVTGQHAGIGYKQQLAGVAGALLVICGALLRVDVVGVLGTALFGLAVTADWVYRSPGIGWKQQALIATSIVVILFACALRLAGFYVSRSRRKRTMALAAPALDSSEGVDARPST